MSLSARRCPDGLGLGGEIVTDFPHGQIAFAGHNRPSDLGDRASAAKALRAAFALLAEAGLSQARLLTGMASGADTLAAAAWHGAGLGTIHAVYPFLGERPPARTRTPVDASTWLDGAAMEAAGRSAHLAQTHWLLGSADLLVVLWDGKRTRGAGGTADAVRLALQGGLSVLWVRPGSGGEPKLIHPPDASQGYDFIELVEQLERGDARFVHLATPEALAGVFASRGLDTPPELPAEAPQTLLARLMHRTLWRTYALFRRSLGGPIKAQSSPAAAPDDLEREPGFVAMTAAYQTADGQANRLAAVHRSLQLFLLFAAVAATAIGSSPSIWPDIKIYAVLGELALALLAIAVWSGAARASRHERWSEARRLAEQLRLERAAWALGLSSVEIREAPGPAARTARALRRVAGSAAGSFDNDRVTRWGAWAVNELVGSQADYHHHQGHRNERIAHRVHMAENVLFAAFVFVLTAFATAYLAAPMLHAHLPHWTAGAVMMLSALVPAIGAAGLALEATLAFREQGQRSLFLAEQLAAINASRVGPCRLDDLQRAARAAMTLHAAQEDRWSEEAARRRLVRGG